MLGGRSWNGCRRLGAENQCVFVAGWHGERCHGDKQLQVTNSAAVVRHAPICSPMTAPYGRIWRRQSAIRRAPDTVLCRGRILTGDVKNETGGHYGPLKRCVLRHEEHARVSRFREQKPLNSNSVARHEDYVAAI